MSAMTEQEQDAAVELLALMRAQEERRKRRNRVLAWLAVALVVVAAIAIPVANHVHQENLREDRINRMVDDMIGRG